MKNMKMKTFLLTSSLLLAVLFSGCGKATAVEESPKSANNEVPQEAVQSESGMGKPESALTEQVLAAYQVILKEAPAVEDEHEELTDASFGYDQNLSLFGNHYDLFALVDINQDEIPELIALSTVNFRWTPVSVFTFADGEAVLLKDPLDMTAHGTFEQMSTANGAYITYICEKNHIHSVWCGTTPMGEAAEENHAYILEGTALTAVDCTAGENESTVNFYEIAKANTAENLNEMLQ